MRNISSKYIGIITGAVMVITALILFYIAKLPVAGESQYAVWGLYSAGIIWALVSYKKSAAEEQTFKAYFSEGFKAFIVAALMMVIYTYIFYKMNPQILENALLEINKYNSADKNKTPQEVIDNANLMRKSFVLVTVAFTTFIYFFIGILVSAIGSGFLSQKKY